MEKDGPFLTWEIFFWLCGLGLGLSCLVLGPALAPHDKEINVKDSLFKTVLHYIFFEQVLYFFPLIYR